MIRLTRLNDKEFFMNAEMIEFVEATPDTIVSMISGKKIMVREPVEEVTERAIDYKRNCSRLSSVAGDRRYQKAIEG